MRPDDPRVTRAVLRIADALGVHPLQLTRYQYRDHVAVGEPRDFPWRLAVNAAVSAMGSPPPLPEPPPPSDPEVSTAEDIAAERRGALQQRQEKRRIQTLTDRVLELEDTVEILTALREQPIEPSPVRRREKKSGIREGTPVVLCSDWHVEETVRSDEVSGLNEYDLEIAEERVRKLAASIVWMIEFYGQRYRIRDLVVWLGGDFISGHIHEELVENNSLSPIEAAMFAQQQIVANLLDVILRETQVERLIVPCSVGNHGRTTRRKHHAGQVKNSYEWMLYQSIRRHYDGEKRVDVCVSGGSLLYLDVYEMTLRFHHGDDIRYFGGIGGPLTPIEKALKGWDVSRKAHITNIGHFHSYLDVPRCVCNGSLIGYSAFSQAIKAPYSPPEQAMYMIDSRRGKRLSTPLWTDER